jgi:hypothetical protein
MILTKGRRRKPMEEKNFWECPKCKEEFEDDPRYWEFIKKFPDNFHNPFCPRCDIELAFCSGEREQEKLSPIPDYVGYHDSTTSDKFWDEFPSATHLYVDESGECEFKN